MYVCLCLGISTWMHVPTEVIVGPLDTGANDQTQVHCKNCHMLFTPEPFIQPPLLRQGLQHNLKLINSAGKAGQWASGIILSLTLLIPGFCVWFLCRFWGSKLRSSCLCTCEAGTWLTESSPHPLLCIFWDGLLVNLEFAWQTLYKPRHCSSPWLLFFLYCSGWIQSLAHCLQARSFWATFWAF